MKDAPKEIIVKFEYKNSTKTPYYCLDTPIGMIERVDLGWALDFCESSGEDDLWLSYWIPSQHGWNCEWRISGEEFINRHKLMEK